MSQPPAVEVLARADLRVLLGEVAPFQGLEPAQHQALAAAATFDVLTAGDLVLDGFRNPPTEVFMVVHGRVGVWQQVDSAGHPDLTEGPGGFFGFSAMLTGRSVGPLVRALTDVVVARIPGQLAQEAFASPEGARFLTDHLLSFASQVRGTPGFATTGALLDQDPVVVDADTTVRRVAQILTSRRLPGVVVHCEDGSLGLVTDGSIRRRVLVEGLDPEAPADQALARGVPLVQLGDPAGEVLLDILGARTEAAIVTDNRGRLKGVVGLREFALSPTTGDVALHEQLRLAADLDELAERARQTPDVLAHLLRDGLASAQVIKVHAGLVDTLVRRCVELCLAEHPGLGTHDFTWLSLGSNGRRESVLSSDIESAVVFPTGMDPELMAAYREVFAEVDAMLEVVGLTRDDNGVSARNAVLARTQEEWLRAVDRWLANPWQDKGAVMISLLVDSRPIVGDPALAATASAVNEMRAHPQTLRLMLNDALSQRPRSRQWDMPFRRNRPFDMKNDALTPLVNLARWASLALGADKLTTPDRLRAAGGTPLLEPRQALVLAEAFEVLQRVRLRSQLDQVAAGRRPTNLVDVEQLSTIDRTIIGEAVHEIAVAQRRFANLGDTLETERLGRRGGV